jgi:hypothetical protein
MLQKNHRILIELFGLPGAGKSTLARELSGKYGYIHIQNEPLSFLEYLRYTITQPRLVFSWLWLICKNFLATKSTTHARYNVSLLFTSLKKLHRAKRARGTVIIDEGLLQRFLSYSDIPLSPQLVRRLLFLSSIGSVIVLVNDRVVLKDRFDSPAHARAKEGPVRLAQWRTTMAENITVVSGVLKTLPSVQYIETKDTSIDAILKDIPKHTL